LASNYQGKITVYTAAALLYPDALATSITLPLEILKAASQMASTRDRGREQVRRLLAGPDRKLIKLASGVTLKPDLSYDQLPALDLLLLPAIWRNPLPTVRQSASWRPQLIELAATGVLLKTRHLITQSENIYCVGSVNSIADLMMHIVEEWFGSRIARAIENQFSPEIRQSFSAAAYQNEADSSHPDETVVQAQQWLQEHLSRPSNGCRSTFPPGPA
jgi:transcriptional regulator GlxA family with amidase domain